MEIKSLKEIAIVEYGKSPKKIKTETSNIPIYGTGGQVGYSKEVLFEGPLTVIARKGSLNNPIYSENDCWIIDTAYAVMCDGACDSKWLYYNFTNFDLSSLNEATGVPSINRNALYNIKFFVPPLPEQKKIASILTTVDDKISSIDNQIQQTEELKKGLMEKLLTEGIGHRSFKDTKIGRIPKGWDVKLLKNVASIERGKFQHRPRNDPRFYGGEYPFVQTGDVGKAKGRLKKYSQTLNKVGLTKSRLFPKGTIIITIAANIGDTAIASFDVAFPDSLVGIIAGRKMDVMFLEYYLRTQKNYLNKLATVNAQKNINLETLKPLSTPVPPIEEQKQIATILSTVDDKIELLNQKKSQYKTLKKGLSQQLLTGQMRVKI